MEFLGKPSDEDIEKISHESARNYMKKQPQCEPMDLEALFKGASAEAIDLLKKIFKFNPVLVKHCSCS